MTRGKRHIDTLFLEIVIFLEKPLNEEMKLARKVTKIIEVGVGAGVGFGFGIRVSVGKFGSNSALIQSSTAKMLVKTCSFKKIDNLAPTCISGDDIDVY